jgi:hypothetical protein
MFHAHYPRLAVSEMTGDPMCSERCFSAPSSAACEQYARREMRSHTLAISTCVSELLESSIGTTTRLNLAELSPMNFFFVLCGEPPSSLISKLQRLTSSINKAYTVPSMPHAQTGPGRSCTRR